MFFFFSLFDELLVISFYSFTKGWNVDRRSVEAGPRDDGNNPKVFLFKNDDDDDGDDNPFLVSSILIVKQIEGFNAAFSR